MKNLWEIKKLRKYFTKNRVWFWQQPVYIKAINDISFTIKQNEIFGCVGESGCGKSTLGYLLLKLIPKTDGKILYQDKDLYDIDKKEIKTFRRNNQLIFQDPYSSLNPRIKIGSAIAEAVKYHKIVPKNDVKDYVCDLLEKVGLNRDYYNRYPHEFSGGQRQRIVIARAISVKSSFIVCDEPLSALDLSVQAQIINLLLDLKKELKLTYFFISHDLQLIEYISDRLMVMYLGKIMEIGDTEKIYKNPLHPYTVSLFDSSQYKKSGNGKILLKGEVPSPINLPSGCVFHTRCPKSFDRCAIEEPLLKSMKKNHSVACHLYD